MSDRDFKRFRNFIYDKCGINLVEAKKTMLTARLQKRLKAAGISSFSQYFDYVTGRGASNGELVQMIDAITTNKTEFFRESAHFDYLTQTALPELIGRSGGGLKKKVTLWSAGCSSGEEPYTLAMVLSEFAEKIPGFDFSILATDISTKVLKTAIAGIYEHEKIQPVPMRLRKKYLLRGKGDRKGLVRIVSGLRSRVKFLRMNLIDEKLDISQPVEVVFCRNVIIYFDRPTREKVINNLAKHLIRGGYMFMGHSETLNGLIVPLSPVAPTVYRKTK
ncbi:MAG: protein-glutamate O-methyltransferase CheR [Deltaproteobacteria bacterium]|nr:protein-glutamate O-methyltransferase CheR [Deltaproteobacteria bacterium]MBW1960216.1 protein-glutamate O-methyltransferase CheR [Deltaproteobacteria bacterium]MBW2150619.1 protein-glutamate O-methyltransferase CheR [Deltaproteobacteria bacterium]